MLTEGPHDQGSQHFKQLTGLLAVQTGGFGDVLLHARTLAAQHVAQDARAIALRGVLQESLQVVEQTAVVITLQGTGQRGGPFGLLGIAGQGTHQYRQGSAYGVFTLLFVEAELLADFPDALLANLSGEHIEELIHGLSEYRVEDGLHGKPAVGNGMCHQDAKIPHASPYICRFAAPVLPLRSGHRIPGPMLLLQLLLLLFLPAAIQRLRVRLKAKDWLSPVVLCYICGILLGNAGFLTLDPELTQGFLTATVVLAIPLLLVGTNLPAWMRQAPSVTLSFGLAVLGVVAASLVTHALFTGQAEQGRQPHRIGA